MARLPTFQTTVPELSLLQSRWSALLNPVISNVWAAPVLLKSVSLKTGNNTVAHTLGRKLTGWLVIRKRSAANLYDTQDSNQHPDLTLTLNSDSNVVIDLLVF